MVSIRLQEFNGLLYRDFMDGFVIGYPQWVLFLRVLAYWAELREN